MPRTPDAASVFKQALAAASAPQQGALDKFRKALNSYDLEGCWTALSPLLPGEPGSHSQKNYFSAVKDFLAWAEREQLPLLSPPAHLGPEFQQYLEEKYGDSLASINTRLSQARRLYKVLRQLGLVPANLDPFSILERSRVEPGGHRVYYTEAEISRLLAQADRAERVLLLLGAHAGLSTAEVLALRWEQVTLPEGVLHLPDRDVPVSPQLERALGPLAEREGGGVLFATQEPLFDFADQNALRARMYTLCLKANVPYRAWRGLRHAAGVRMYAQSGNLETVAKQMGVMNPHLVRMYKEVVEGQPQQE